MPWDANDFVRGGQGSLRAFNGRLRRVDKDVPVTLGGKAQLQRQLHFFDIDPLSIVAEKGYVSPADRTFTGTLRESNRKSGTLFKMTVAWLAFGKSIGAEIPEGLIGHMVRYERKDVPGSGGEDDPFASSYLCPIRIIDDSVASEVELTRTKVDTKSLMTKEVVGALVLGVKDGSTLALIRRELMASPEARQVIAAAGGIEPVLAAAVEHDVLTLKDGTYRVAGGTPA